MMIIPKMEKMEENKCDKNNYEFEIVTARSRLSFNVFSIFDVAALLMGSYFWLFAKRKMSDLAKIGPFWHYVRHTF